MGCPLNFSGFGRLGGYGEAGFAGARGSHHPPHSCLPCLSSSVPSASVLSKGTQSLQWVSVSSVSNPFGYSLHKRHVLIKTLIFFLLVLGTIPSAQSYPFHSSPNLQYSSSTAFPYVLLKKGGRCSCLITLPSY